MILLLLLDPPRQPPLPLGEKLLQLREENERLQATQLALYGESVAAEEEAEEEAQNRQVEDEDDAEEGKREQDDEYEFPASMPDGRLREKYRAQQHSALAVP